MVNVGSGDRILRVIVGVILLILPVIPAADIALAKMGMWIWALPVIGAILLVTAFLRVCPLYSLLGLRTCPANPREERS